MMSKFKDRFQLTPDVSSPDKALEAFIWGARGQFFWDGNKRTSLMLANKILVSSGSGIMTITDKYMVNAQ